MFAGAVAALLSCERIDDGGGRVPSGRDAGDLSHEEIVLGRQLENPYRTENISKALAALYPTKAGVLPLQSTDCYVRFLPKDQEEFDSLKALGIELLDHPVDFEIVREGDWYHDPSIEEDGITWQYAVVPKDFIFPEIEHQILHECYLPSDDASTRADGIDWAAVEAKAYELTGNAGMLEESCGTRGGKVNPSGRITIVDEDANGGRPFGVAGVTVSCNAFVKFAKAYTDRDGYYSIGKGFSSRIRYRLIFKNEKNFSIGMNLVLVPASVSTLGKNDPSGVSLEVTEASDSKLFRRCIINNAVYDYIERCAEADMNIAGPPADLRLWILNALDCSSAPMIHQGAVVSHSLVAAYLGAYSLLVKLFAPDITLGTAGRETYSAIYAETVHELAHASHFSSVGKDYWNKYVEYILKSFAASGSAYGTGTEENSGYCEVGEMWAYYLQSVMFQDRYGGSVQQFGWSEWFHPQIFHYLDARGIGREQIFAVLKPGVSSLGTLKSALIQKYPVKRTMIEQAFAKYSGQ